MEEEAWQERRFLVKVRRQGDFVGVAECGTDSRYEVGGLTRAWLLNLVSEKLLREFSEENPCEKGRKDGQKRCPSCDLESFELGSMASPELQLGIELQ